MLHSLTACVCQQGHCYVNCLSSVWGRVVVLVLSKLSVYGWPAVTRPIDISILNWHFISLSSRYHVVELMCIVKLPPCQYMKE